MNENFRENQRVWFPSVFLYKKDRGRALRPGFPRCMILMNSCPPPPREGERDLLVHLHPLPSSRLIEAIPVPDPVFLSPGPVFRTLCDRAYFQKYCRMHELTKLTLSPLFQLTSGRPERIGYRLQNDGPAGFFFIEDLWCHLERILPKTVAILVASPASHRGAY